MILLGSQKIIYFKPENTAEVLNGINTYLKWKLLFLSEFEFFFFRFSSIWFRHILDQTFIQ